MLTFSRTTIIIMLTLLKVSLNVGTGEMLVNKWENRVALKK